MTAPITIIESILSPNSDISKIIEDAWNDSSDNFWTGIDLSMNPVFDFKVEKVPEIEDEEDDDFQGTLTWNKFYNIAVSLVEDKLEADARYKLINEAAMSANAKEWNLWYRKILMKSLHKSLPMDRIAEEITRLTRG